MEFKMKTKFIRMNLKTWNKLRRQIKGRKNETCADYLDRVLIRINPDIRKFYVRNVEC